MKSVENLAMPEEKYIAAVRAKQGPLTPCGPSPAQTILYKIYSINKTSGISFTFKKKMLKEVVTKHPADFGSCGKWGGLWVHRATASLGPKLDPGLCTAVRK